MNFFGRALALGLLTLPAFSPLAVFAGQQPGIWAEPYDANALYPRRNLLTYSEDFTNAAWARSNILSVTSKADGVGDLAVPNATVANHTLVESSVGSAGAPSVFKVRAKAAGYNWIIVSFSNGLAYFNVGAGAVGTTTGGFTASIAAVAGAPGYYDCTLVGVPSSIGATIYVANGDGSANFAGDGVSGVYFARGQFEINTSAASTYQKVTDWNTEYLAAVGAANVGMWQDNLATAPTTAISQPVGDWVDRSGQSHSLTQATSANRPTLSALVNLLSKTENFDDSVWTKAGISVVADAIAGPDGRVVGNKLIMASGSSNHYVISNGNFSNGGLTPHRFQFILKDGGQRYAQIGFANTGWASSYANFDLAGGVVGSFGGAAATASSIQSLGGGWYLCTVTTTAPTVTGYPLVFISGCATALDGYAPTFTGDGVSSIYCAGADLRTVNDWNLPYPTYQRVNTTSDYDTAGFPFKLVWNGTNTCIQTSTLTAGTLTNNMDLFLLIRRTASGQMVPISQAQNDGAKYVGVWQSGSAAVANSGAGANNTTAVDGVVLDAGVATCTRDQLNTAMTVGQWHVLELRNLDLSTWTQLTIGGYTSYFLAAEIAGFVLCPAQDNGMRQKIRSYLSKKEGLTL